MAPRKKGAVSRGTTKTESPTTSLHHKSWLERIPSSVRFILVVASNLILSTLLFTLTASITLRELGNVSKQLEAWEVGGLIAWKAVEVGLAWILGYDGRDASSFIFLVHLPTYALLASFYNIRPTTVLVSYAIVLFSTSIPFILLRSPTSVHNLSHVPWDVVSNRSILQDRPTTIYTTVVATSIFTVTLYLSYATFLPSFLVVHFEPIPNISAVHAGPAGLPILFVSLLPFGWAARDFLFASSAGAVASSPPSSSKSEESTKKGSGSPSREGEYLACAVYRKTWGTLSVKTKVLVSRTFVLAGILVGNTIIQVAGTIDGADIKGASVWGAVWAVATFVVAGTFGWIEAVDGV
ncbi:hypothetical protein EYZ11_010052 [Aspergillus tanneri]|uniref:Uncharacterized protein n=1 Tax=Aspergillus tanneri TaxID=1220188 RepID=A0A4S3J8F9_9EURO|nr:uncharacterized protein ATNIH1004_007620 [Aspergillus tanneri]KAA8646194.1 hypothetical protein ATNIH1004_007620 [Aspergillus tanneri]THC90488.1 hypothetical protein EYZ11_010052 [Aspergillus tanneri]